MNAREAGGFGLLVGVCAIFIDAAIAHGLFWDNDPYWTYWITKTALITTVYTIGTAWFGAGLGRGALITVVHTLILEIYYQVFAPVGLPQEPEWLDFNHLWTTGLPVHYLAIYAGYLLALWLWRRRLAGTAEPAKRAAVSALAIVVLALAFSGIVTHGLLLRAFPGFTYVLQHLLVGFVFVYLWTSAARLDGPGWWLGGLMLALVWTSYSLYVGPVGLPSQPPRYFGYEELWLRAFPGDVIAGCLSFGLVSRWRRGGRATGGAVASMVFLLSISPVPARAAGGLEAHAQTEGAGLLVVGKDPVNMRSTVPLEGYLRLRVVEGGNRWSPIQNRDGVSAVAEFTAQGSHYRVVVDQAMPRHPFARYTTWNGVVFNHLMHGDTGIGTPNLPRMRPAIAVYGWAKVYREGKLIAPMAFTHIMINPEPPMQGVMLEVETETRQLLGAPDGYLTAMWPRIDAMQLPVRAERLREFIGWIALIGLTALFAWLAYREPRRG